MSAPNCHVPTHERPFTFAEMLSFMARADYGWLASDPINVEETTLIELEKAGYVELGRVEGMGIVEARMTKLGIARYRWGGAVVIEGGKR